MVWFPEKILQHFPPHAPAWATMCYQDTWLLASCLIVNNFLVADQMRRLTSVAKQLGAGIDDFFRQVEGFYSPNRFTCMGFLLLRKGCLPWSYDFDCVSGLASSECWVSHLSPTLGLVGRMISLTCLPFVFHLSPTCLPLWVWLVA